MRELGIIFLAIILGSCTATPVQPQSDILPTLANPPQLHQYVKDDDRIALNHYYKLLANYYAYLGEYLDFLSKQYDFEPRVMDEDCRLIAKQERLYVSKIPNVTGLSDERVLDLLVDHIGKVFLEIRAYNRKVDERNQVLAKKCSKS